MSNFYTNVIQNRGKIYVKSIKNGKRHREIIKYKPYIFLPSKEETSYKTLDGSFVDKMKFDSIWEAKEYLKTYKDVDGFEIYGLKDFKYLYIYDNYKGHIDFDPKLVSVVGIDIENAMTIPCDMITAVTNTPNEITAITMQKDGKSYMFGCKEYEVPNNSVIYFKCKSERDLLMKFIQVWERLDPDIITGWNVEFYDVPYIVNRIIRILGEDEARRLSPWGLLNPYSVQVYGKDCPSYTIEGVSVLDYMQLYKKFIHTPRESYKLDYIAQVELDEQKLDYSEYDNLDDLYDRNYQKFLDYNRHDVTLISKLEDKLKLIELVMYLSYYAKINYNDALGSVKPWDMIIHAYLMDKNIVIPNPKMSYGGEFAGGFVKDPIVGMHKWVVTFDLDGLYPHCIMGINIGPETFVGRMEQFPSIDMILEGNWKAPRDYSYAGNGCYYRRDIRGFMTELMEEMYSNRKEFKKQMLHYKDELEKTHDKKLNYQIAYFNNMQMLLKIFGNSLYGVLSNKYCRWYSINNAEAITLSGQLAIKWISKKLNEYVNSLLKTKDVDYIMMNDTDSCGVILDKLVQKIFPNETDNIKITRALDKFCNEIIQPKIEEWYQELADVMNSYQQKMRMKREAICSRTIAIAKKRYIYYVHNLEGVEFKEPYLKMTGIQAIQSSTPAVCRDAIKIGIKKIMETDEESVQKYIQEYRKTWGNYNFAEIASPRGITDLDKWNTKGEFKSGTPIHVKGAILYNRLIDKENPNNKYQKIGNGDKIKFCYLKKPNPHFCNVVACPDELPKHFDMEKYLDYDIQFQKAFVDPLANILKPIGWEVEKKATLSSFFE